MGERTAGGLALLFLFAAGEAQAEEPWPPHELELETWEYVAAPSLLAAAAATRLLVPLGDANVTGPSPLLDEEARDAFRAEGTARDVWTAVGDAFYLGSLANTVLEPPLSAGLGHGRWDMAGRLMMVNMEAYAVASSLLFFSQLAVRRVRPRSTGCDAEPAGCSDGDKRSLPGGHLTIAVTNAALTCQHHLDLGLYGNRAADIATCAFWAAGAAATFVSRLTNEAHYLSDQLLGMGVGLLSGWLVPWLLHYRDIGGEAVPGARWLVLPGAAGAQAGLSATVVF